MAPTDSTTLIPKTYWIDDKKIDANVSVRDAILFDFLKRIAMALEVKKNG